MYMYYVLYMYVSQEWLWCMKANDVESNLMTWRVDVIDSSNLVIVSHDSLFTRVIE